MGASLNLANFKGTVFESTRVYTERQFGPEAVERVLRELPEDDRALLAGVQAIGWYPVEPILRYHHALDHAFGAGDLNQCVEAGRFSASWSMNRVLKVFLRFKSPMWLVDKATQVWDRYHDTGTWKVSSPGHNQITGELSGFAVKDPAFCARLCGWLEGAITVTGGTGAIAKETRCACNGGDQCVFQLSWN